MNKQEQKNIKQKREKIINFHRKKLGINGNYKLEIIKGHTYSVNIQGITPIIKFDEFFYNKLERDEEFRAVITHELAHRKLICMKFKTLFCWEFLGRLPIIKFKDNLKKARLNLEIAADKIAYENQENYSWKDLAFAIEKDITINESDKKRRKENLYALAEKEI
ncbi:MAG: hypothetical protein GTO02_17840 [Candidatus Dadabacteria bacterium]|nr:hypothetical protein [Candidatus Dadabacteria bacterium]